MQCYLLGTSECTGHLLTATYCLTICSIALHGEQLRAHLRVINTDDKPFEFTAALHSYFEVLDITKAKVRGLKGESRFFCGMWL